VLIFYIFSECHENLSRFGVLSSLTFCGKFASVNNIDDIEQSNKQQSVYIQSRDFSVNIHLYLFHVYYPIQQRQSGNLFPNISELHVN
jgi:hypothetical protein